METQSGDILAGNYEFGLQEHRGWKGVFERNMFQLLMDCHVI
jgi:hypothetical protein